MKRPEGKVHSPTIVYKRKGVYVKDAYTGLNLEVLPEDIQGAVCGDHSNCVFARTIKRVLKPKFVDVGAEIVIIGISATRAKRYRLSMMARKQIRYFDTHEGRAAPCRVQLLRIPKSRRLGVVQTGEVYALRKRWPINRRPLKMRRSTR